MSACVFIIFLGLYCVFLKFFIIKSFDMVTNIWLQIVLGAGWDTLVGPQHLQLTELASRAGPTVPCSFDLLHFQSEPRVSLTCGRGCQLEPAQDTPTLPWGACEHRGVDAPGAISQVPCLKVHKQRLCEVKGPLHGNWSGTELEQGFCLHAFYGTQQRALPTVRLQ